MPRINRIRKIDKTVVQAKKIIRNQVKKTGTTSSSVVSGTYTTTVGQGDPGAGEGVGVQTNVIVVDGSQATRAQINPEGALYAVDDEDNDQIDLRHSSLADPFLFLSM